MIAKVRIVTMRKQTTIQEETNITAVTIVAVLLLVLVAVVQEVVVVGTTGVKTMTSTMKMMMMKTRRTMGRISLITPKKLIVLVMNWTATNPCLT